MRKREKREREKRQRENNERMKKKKRKKQSKEGEKARFGKHGQTASPGTLWTLIYAFRTYTARQSSKAPQRRRRLPRWQRPAERCDPKITVKICSV